MNPRPWYKKKRYIILVIIAVGLAVLGSGNTPPQASPAPISPAVVSPSNVLPDSATQEFFETVNTQGVVIPATTVSSPTPTSPPIQDFDTGLSNDNYYINSSGNSVHSPAYSTDGSLPAGATAKCRDGTYSFSQHRSGTCSHHGGVARWL